MSGPPAGGASREAVVLVHGLWMPGLELALLARRLERCGFTVRRFRYPTVGGALEAHLGRLQALVAGIDAPRVHFVGHSLGGLVVLQLLARQPPARAGRVVLLGSPIRGSAAAARLARHPLARRLLGRAPEAGLVAGIGDERDWDREIGMIAGRAPVGLGGPLGGLPRPHDGTVAVEETRAPWLTDHLTLPVSHFSMLFSRRVVAAVCRFLASGRFASAASDVPVLRQPE